MGKAKYHHGNLRQALIDAAIEVLEEKGAPALTLRHVARRAGVSQAAPYHHFSDKDALLGAVAAEGFRTLRDSMRAAEERAGGNALAKLKATGKAYVTHALAHPAHFRVMFSPLLAAGTGSPYPDLREASLEAFGVLVSAVERAQKATGRKNAAPFELALAGWSMVHGLATLWLDGPLHTVGGKVPSAAELADRFTELCIRGAGLSVRWPKP
jgi:AcrR family transcriptional regulator